MANSGEKLLIMTVNVETGDIESVEVKEGNGVEPVPPEKMEEADPNRLQALRGLAPGSRHVTTIYHAHFSPGCVYYYYRGRWYVVCS